MPEALPICPKITPLERNGTLAEALALIAEANRARDGRREEDKGFALRAYGRAIDMLTPLASPADPRACDELASAWTNRGIAFAGNWLGPALPGEAAACFERARLLREPLVALPNPWYRYNFAGVLMNLAAVAPGGRAGALSAHAAAVSATDCLEAREHALFGRRKWVAAVNYAAALLDGGSGEDLEAAVRILDRALTIAESAGPEDPAAPSSSSGVLAAKADALCRLGRLGESREASRAALAGLEGRSLDLQALEISLKARHSLCAAAATQLLSAHRSAASQAAIEEAADRAEDGLDLFLQAGCPADCALLATELTRFCAQAYARLRPQFLSEFLREHGGSAPWVPAESRAMVLRALRDAASTISGYGFAQLTGPEFDRAIEAFQGLRAAADGLGPGAGGRFDAINAGKTNFAMMESGGVPGGDSRGNAWMECPALLVPDDGPASITAKLDFRAPEEKVAAVGEAFARLIPASQLVRMDGEPSSKHSSAWTCHEFRPNRPGYSKVD